MFAHTTTQPDDSYTIIDIPFIE